MDKIAVIGVGSTEFGDLYDRAINEIAVEALFDAIRSSGVKKDDIKSLFIGNMGSEMFVKQEHLGNMVSTLADLPVPSFKVEAAGASGAVAMRTAYHSIQSGHMDIVGVIGVEKMTEFTKQSETQGALATGLDVMWESNMGGTLATGFAMMAKAHMREYGTTREQIAQVAVKNHQNAKKNPKSQFKINVRVESILRSKMIADPLRLFDMTAACDGGSALILASPEVAESYDSDPVYIHTSKFGYSPLQMHLRKDLTTLTGTTFAAERAYENVGITAKDIDLAEVHDIFTIAEILAIESLGLVEKGKGGQATEDGVTSLEGSIPINTSGGLKGRGAPLGAVGVSQAIEMYEQFKGLAGDRQIKNIEWGLTHSMGGTGGTSLVTIFGR